MEAGVLNEDKRDATSNVRRQRREIELKSRGTKRIARERRHKRNIC